MLSNTLTSSAYFASIEYMYIAYSNCGIGAITIRSAFIIDRGNAVDASSILEHIYPRKAFRTVGSRNQFVRVSSRDLLPPPTHRRIRFLF